MGDGGASAWEQAYERSTESENQRRADDRARRVVVRWRRRGYPRTPDFPIIDSVPAFLAVIPFVVGGWLLSTLWFRGSCNVIVMEQGGGRLPRLISCEVCPNRRTAEERVEQLRGAAAHGQYGLPLAP